MEKQLSRWEKAGIVGGIVTPLAIAAATIYLDHQISSRAQQYAEQQDKLARLALVPAFLDARTGDADEKRILALRTINRVLPDEAPTLLLGVVEAEVSPEVTAAAQFALQIAELQPYAEGLYADTLAEREKAFAVLASARNPSAVVRSVLDQISRQPWHLNGTVNAWRVLERISAETLSPFADEVWALELMTQGNGPQTALAAETVRRKATAGQLTSLR